MEACGGPTLATAAAPAPRPVTVDMTGGAPSSSARAGGGWRQAPAGPPSSSIFDLTVDDSDGNDDDVLFGTTSAGAGAARARKTARKRGSDGAPADTPAVKTWVEVWLPLPEKAGGAGASKPKVRGW